MIKYGVSFKRQISPSKPLFTYILSLAPLSPREAYALAAEHDVMELAIPVSCHLLSIDLTTITDEIVHRMGPLYLRRLLFLHMDRTNTFKKLILPAPLPHANCVRCDPAKRKNLTKAWELAIAYLVWDAKPGQLDRAQYMNMYYVYGFDTLTTSCPYVSFS